MDWIGLDGFDWFSQSLTVFLVSWGGVTDGFDWFSQLLIVMSESSV